MPIPQTILDRIQGSAISPDKVAGALVKLAKVLDATDGDDGAVTLEFVTKDDALKAGDLVPVVTFALLRVPSDTPEGEVIEVISTPVEDA